MYVEKMFKSYVVFLLITLSPYYLVISAFAQARQPVVAGAFYPAEKNELSGFIDAVLSKAEKKKTGKVLGILVPHAGYVFSGGVAAHAYAAILGSYETVVLLGAAHTMPVKGAAVYSKGAFETPLGQVKIDEKLAEALIKESPLFEDNAPAHAREHCLEVQLPFLQKKLKNDFRILPIVLNTENIEELVKIGELLAKHLKNKNVLFVISSDLSHYPGHNLAGKADESVLLAYSTMDPEYFWLANRILSAKNLPELATTACGEAAMTAGLAALKNLGTGGFVKLKYADSYDTNPQNAEKERVVGYGAGVFVKGEGRKPFRLKLNAKQKEELLKLARESIRLKFEEKSPFIPLLQRGKEGDLSDDYVFNLPAAVFVTLTINKNLRGCIGNIQPQMTLRDAVMHSAQSAAFDDHRFAPLSKDEFEKIEIEISLLSPIRQANGENEIIPGKSGVIIARDGRSGLFLPQVWEKIPDKTDFLNEICTQKAGLEKECWKDKNSKIFTFIVESFEESTLR
ncbi:MAG: AmmeMemoRadiSam system protein B [Elusimicrobia bacterium]|nr:AmmeMemoRadiSam system protein B [Elusimicrobiota bacterium]